MSTYDDACARGLTRGTIANAPLYQGHTVARVVSYQFSYVMVRYPTNATVGYLPHLLTKANTEQTQHYWNELKTIDPERYAWLTTEAQA